MLTIFGRQVHAGGREILKDSRAIHQGPSGSFYSPYLLGIEGLLSLILVMNMEYRGNPYVGPTLGPDPQCLEHT